MGSPPVVAVAVADTAGDGAPAAAAAAAAAACGGARAGAADGDAGDAIWYRSIYFGEREEGHLSNRRTHCV